MLLAKQYNCDYRTVKRYYEAGISNKLPLLAQKNKNKKTLVSDFEDIIADKLALGCSSSAIYHFISKRGYRGSARTLRRYCRNIEADKIQKATIRVETTPGLSAQVDWKEDHKLVNKFGEVISCNIFLYVLGYSRIKYLELTFDRSQTTLFRCLTNAFQYTGGVPTEIWFDNMKTVVDRSRSQFSKVVFNERFRQYAMDTNNNILFIGNSGVGKTHLAISITLEAITKGYSCHFALSNELVNRLNLANQRGNLDRLLKKYASYDLLIIDEIGYLPFTPDGAKLFFQLINLRYEKNQPLLQRIFLCLNGLKLFKIKN